MTLTNIYVHFSHVLVLVAITVSSSLRVILTAGAVGTNCWDLRIFKVRGLLLLTIHLSNPLPVLLQHLSLSSPSSPHSLSSCPLHLHGALRESVLPKCDKGFPVRASRSQRWQQSSKHTNCGVVVFTGGQNVQEQCLEIFPMFTLSHSSMMYLKVITF